MPTLSFEVRGGGELQLSPQRLIVAGYTGRDEAAVKRHIDELAEAGIAPPPAVPMYYDLEPTLLTTAARAEVSGAETSGEVEPVYVRSGGAWFLGVGSDHTDRALERADVARSKASCAKPIGRMLLPLPADLTDGGYDDVWDRIVVRCWADDSIYQHGTLDALRPPSDLLTRLPAELAGGHSTDLVVYGGTVPLRDGRFVFGCRWRLALEVPGAEPIQHAYETASAQRSSGEVNEDGKA